MGSTSCLSTAGLTNSVGCMYDVVVNVGGCDKNSTRHCAGPS